MLSVLLPQLLFYLFDPKIRRHLPSQEFESSPAYPAFSVARSFQKNEFVLVRAIIDAVIIPVRGGDVRLADIAEDLVGGVASADGPIYQREKHKNNDDDDKFAVWKRTAEHK